MITIRRSSERGANRLDWLDSRNTFSFGDYYDLQHSGFRALRVINEDRVQPGQGFGMHGHRDMEIISYVLEGKLEHKDSLGHGCILQPGDLQCMTAGTGIRHSEFNPSKDELAHFFQIWILPDRAGHAPRYDQRNFLDSAYDARFQLVASPDGRDGSLTIHQDAEVFLCSLKKGDEATKVLRSGRHAWLQVLRGALQLNRTALAAGDGAAVSEETSLVITGTETAKTMLFDLP
jgi:redox-sensitive bicupin YhaK (pirin superfamily)